MNGHELCAVYLAVKLHFTSDKYDFTKGAGKTKIGPEAFNKRKDKYKFHKLSRTIPEDEVVPFLVANFINNDSIWSQDLLSDDAERVYTEWKRKIESLTYTFENDFLKILAAGSINEVFDPKDGGYPVVLTMYMQGELTIETMVILNELMDYLKRWDKKIADTVIYPKIAMKIRKYQSFLAFDKVKLKLLIKKHLTKEAA